MPKVSRGEALGAHAASGLSPSTVARVASGDSRRPPHKTYRQIEAVDATRCSGMRKPS